MGPQRKSFNPLASSAASDSTTGQQLSELELTVQTLSKNLELLSSRLSPLESLQQELLALKSENARLLELNASQANEIAALREQTKAIQAQTLSVKESSPTDAAPPALANGASHSGPSPTRTPVAPASSWATVTARPAKNKVRRRAAAARAFQTVSGPQGFEYVYIPRSHRMSHTEARRRLGTLGVESWRVLDVCFPAHGVAGVLVHTQYKEALLALLAKAKIPVREDFDPLDPAHLADPAHLDKPESVRQVELTHIVAKRSRMALERLRYPVAVAVSRFFLENGMISDEEVSHVLNAKPDCPRYSRHRDDPAADDTMSVTSAASRHSVASSMRSL